MERCCSASGEVNQETRGRSKNLANIAGEAAMSEVTSILCSSPLFERLAKFDSKRYYQEMKNTSGMSPTGFSNSARAIADMKSLTSYLGKIAVTTLVIAGGHDIPYVEFSEIFVGRIHGSEGKIVPDVGHISNLEQPNVFNQISRDFFAKHSF